MIKLNNIEKYYNNKVVKIASLIIVQRKTRLSSLYPLLAFGAGLIITLGTISVQAYKAATANPIKSLRYE